MAFKLLPSASHWIMTTSSARSLALQHSLYLILTAAAMTGCLPYACAAPRTAPEHGHDGVAGWAAPAAAPGSTAAASSSGGCSRASDSLTLRGSGSVAKLLQPRRLLAAGGTPLRSSTLSAQPCRPGLGHQNPVFLSQCRRLHTCTALRRPALSHLLCCASKAPPEAAHEITLILNAQWRLRACRRLRSSSPARLCLAPASRSST